MKIAHSITELIGNTPLVELNRLSKGLPGRVVAKLGPVTSFSYKGQALSAEEIAACNAG